MFIRYGVFFIVGGFTFTLHWVNIGCSLLRVSTSRFLVLVWSRIPLYGEFLFRDIEINFDIRVIEIDPLIINIVPEFPEKRSNLINFVSCDATTDLGYKEFMVLASLSKADELSTCDLMASTPPCIVGMALLCPCSPTPEVNPESWTN